MLATAQAEIEDILKQLENDHDWRIERRKGHPVALPPNRSLSPMTVSMTPGTQNWRKTLGAELRRRGFTLEGTRVMSLAAARAAATTPQAAPEPPPAPREDPPEVSNKTAHRKPRTVVKAGQPGPDDIISVDPSVIPGSGGEGGFPGKTTEKVMTITFGDGRQVYECTWPDCNEQRDTFHGVLYHRRDHKSAALRIVPDQPTGEQVDEAVEQIEQARERVAEVQAEQAAAAAAVVEPETPAASAAEVDAPEMPLFDEDLSEMLAEAGRAASTITGLVRQVQKLRAANQILRDEAEQASKHRDEAESDLGEWRRRAHAAEAVVNQIRGIAGATTAA